MLNIKKSAFTLTEILIALTIIGIVAAITVPRVMTGIKAKAGVVKLKKAYTSLKEATRLAALRTGYDFSDVTALDNSRAAETPRNVQDFYATSFEATARSGERYEYTVSGNALKFVATGHAESIDVGIVENDDYSDDFAIYGLEDDPVGSMDLLLIGKNRAYYVFQRLYYDPSARFNRVCVAWRPCVVYIDVNGQDRPNEIITCTEGENIVASIPSFSAYSNGEGVIEPEPCTVDDSAVTDIYPFIIYDAEIVPATSAVMAVLAK